MNKYTGTKLLLILSSVPLSAVCSAVDFNVQGFGTIGVVRTNNDQIDYVTSVRNQANGAGHTRTYDFMQDSRLGIHIDAKINSKWSANFQAVENRTAMNDWVPEIRWASIKYQATPDLFLRIGRIAVPSYVYSDSVSLGYTYPWVRLPTEIYSKIPSKWQDSIDFKYHIRLADDMHLNLSATATLPFERNTATETKSESDGAQAFMATLEYDYWEFGVRYGQTKIKVTTPRSNQLFAAYRGLAIGLRNAGNTAEAAQAEALSRQYNETKLRTTFTSLGAMYDDGQYLFLSEYLVYHADKQLAGDTAAWFATLGYYWRDFTPFISYGSNKSKSPKSLPGVDTTNISNPGLNAQASGLNGGLNAAVAALRYQDQTSITIGTRWDFAENFAAKLQYDRFMLDDNSVGLFINPQPDFERGTNINMISASIDFVF